MRISARSGMQGRECPHLLLVNNALYPELIHLNNDALYELAEGGKFRVSTQDTVGDCVDLKYGCKSYNHPIIVPWKDNHIHLSVYNSRYMNIPVPSRTVVSYNIKSGRLDCHYKNEKYFCIHKAVTLWYLHQIGKLRDECEITDDIFMPEDPKPCKEETVEPSDDLIYPPKDAEILQGMATYISSRKRILFPLPRDLCNKLTKDIPRTFIQVGKNCHTCGNALVQLIKISSSARILTLNSYIKAVETFFTRCNSCQTHYRYQEYKDSVHNFDDIFLIGLDLCNFLRISVKNHQAVGTICDVVSKLFGSNVNSNQVLNAYFHFKAMIERSYKFNWVTCGHYPHILIADVNQIVRLHLNIALQKRLK